MPGYVFDSVLVGPDLMTTEEFLALPLHARIRAMLDGKVDFFRGKERVDRREALASLRAAQAGPTR